MFREEYEHYFSSLKEFPCHILLASTVTVQFVVFVLRSKKKKKKKDSERIYLGLELC